LAEDVPRRARVGVEVRAVGDASPKRGISLFHLPQFHDLSGGLGDVISLRVRALSLYQGKGYIYYTVIYIHEATA